MISFFQKFFQSKIGLAITFAFLALIAFAFASMDVANTGTFGGIAGGDRVAVVGDERISTSDLSRATTNAVDQVRQENPTITIPEFVQGGGLNQVLDRLIDRAAIAGFAEDIGLRAGNNLVNSEIRTIPAFRGPDGNFSDDVYRQALQSIGVSDTDVREDLGAGLLAQQVLQPASFGAVMPRGIAREYAQLFRERRQGSIALLPSTLYAPEGDPTQKQLSTYYQENRGRYVRPERRIIRYATFGADALEGRIEPTDAEIARYYEENAAEYAASEERRYSQVIASTQAQAQAIAQAVRGGQSIEAAAQASGFRAVPLGPATKSTVAQESSAAVANAYFAANEGGVTAPARSGLGWHVARIEDVTRRAGRPLVEVRGEIADAVRQRKLRAGLADLGAQVEEQLDEGQSLAHIARDIGVSVNTTQQVTADGSIYGAEDGAQIDETLAPALATAFQMEESEPQIAEIRPGEEYLVFEVSRITESATAPLAEISQQVTNDWRVARGLAAARDAAGRVISRLQQGSSMAEALGAEEPNLPPVQNIDLTREQLAQLREQRVPPPLALMFSMAQGTAKRLEAAGRQGFYVVDLETIEAGEIEDSSPLIAQAQRQLGATVVQEYQQQLQAAMRAQQGVERNDAAIAAVRRQLLGDN